MNVLLAQAADVSTMTVGTLGLGVADVPQTLANFAVFIIGIIGIILVIIFFISGIVFLKIRKKVLSTSTEKNSLYGEVKKLVRKRVSISRGIRWISVLAAGTGAYLLKTDPYLGHGIFYEPEPDEIMNRDRLAIIGFILIVVAFCTYVVGMIVRYKAYRTSVTSYSTGDNRVNAEHKKILLDVFISSALQLIPLSIIWSILNFTVRY